MVVMSYVDLLQEEPEELSTFQAESLKKMERHVDQLQDLVKKLLAYTTVQSKDTLMLQREELRLTSVVESAVKSLSGLIEKSGADVRWGREAMALLPAVRADPQLIEEVIKGLVENAVKFNPAENGIHLLDIYGSILLFLAAIVIAALAVAISSRFNMMVTLSACMGLFLLGLISDYVFGRFAETHIWARVGRCLVPNLQVFWISDAIYEGTQVPARYLLISGSYAIFYTVGILALAVALFQRRQVG